ncbi:MAG: hypothetical protein RI947_1201 [Candidatus Parcubacteria bacterium]|jgi:DNA polymerase III delta subunit
MLQIICGEDVTASRTYFQQLKTEYKKKGYEIKLVPMSEVEELPKWILESPSLFAPQILYVTENLVRKLKQKKSKELYSRIDEAGAAADVFWIDWENDLTSRDITTLKNHKIKEFKPAESIFGYLDKCYPGNLQGFVESGEKLLDTVEEGFIFAMLSKHIRTLLLIQNNAAPKTIQAWQAGRLRSQVARWKPDKLIAFYEGLARIDVSLKTSSNMHGIKKSVDILACYYL